MRPVERAGYLCHARTTAYARRMGAAQTIVSLALLQCQRENDRPYVACSLGKDSAVLTHLVHQADPTVPVRMIEWEEETEALHRDAPAVVGAWRERFGITVEKVVLTRDSLSDARSDRWETLRSDSTAVFLGLRMEESRGRRIALRSQGAIYRLKSTAVLRICPLARLLTDDIAAYIAVHDLPTLRAYDAGMETRTAARVPRASVRDQAMAQLRERDPDGYRRLLYRFPELGAIAGLSGSIPGELPGELPGEMLGETSGEAAL